MCIKSHGPASSSPLLPFFIPSLFLLVDLISGQIPLISFLGFRFLLSRDRFPFSKFVVVCEFEISREKMNNFVAQQKKSSGVEEETRAAVETVVCPKPRRLGLLHATLDEPANCVRPLRWHSSHNQELFDARAGNELLDIILSKGNYGSEQSHSPIALSPPFFCGSPPSRVSNPIVQDSLFMDAKCVRENFGLSGLSPSPTSARKPGGCVRENFGNNPAVRVEGFDCLDRDRRNRSIPTLA